MEDRSKPMGFCKCETLDDFNQYFKWIQGQTLYELTPYDTAVAVILDLGLTTTMYILLSIYRLSSYITKEEAGEIEAQFIKYKIYKSEW